MAVVQEIQYLKDQIRLNQIQFARCMEEKDSIAMDYLADKNRELINRLKQYEERNRWLDRPLACSR